MPLGPVSMSVWGLPVSQAPRQPDPAPPAQAQGAAGAPAFGKTPEPDQPAPQRVQPGQGPQDQQPEAQGRRRDQGAAVQMSASEQSLLRELKQTDAKVRAHEQAHVAAGGSAVRGGASYDYEVGPDNRAYAVGGEVQIDASPVPGDPEATMAKAQTVRRAALAPSDPSPQDQTVAAQAASMEAQARTEAATQRREDERAEAQGQAQGEGEGQASAEDGQPAQAQEQGAVVFPRRAAPPPLSARLNPLNRWA